MQFVSWKPVLRAPASILHKLPIPTGIVDLSGNRDQLWLNYIAEHRDGRNGQDAYRV